MSIFEVKILEPSGIILEIETIAGDSSSNLEISQNNTNLIEIVEDITLLPSVFNTLIDAKIASFISAGSGTIVNSSPSGMIISSPINAGSGIILTLESGIYNISANQIFNTEDIEDFVANFLTGNSGVILYYDDNNSSLIIGTSGLQPSGDYSIVGHSHVSSDITDFNTSVSGVLPSVSGSGYAVTSFDNNVYTISVTGVQPSGDYSVVGHNHTSSDITDFNIAVSGLIPASNFTSLSGISGITVTTSGTDYTISLTDPSVELLDITDLSSDARTFLLSPSSSNLQTLITNETGSGLLVFNTSPALSGTPTVPTAPSGTNNTQIANTAFVRTEISNLVNSAPSTLDTLNELATALNNDANFANTIASGLAQKANLSGANFSGTVTAPSGDFGILSQSGVLVSVSGHTHSSSDIVDFNSSVSGLLPITSLAGNSGIIVSNTGTAYNISSSGLAFLSGANFTSLSVTGIPVSISGHQHSYTDIINFASGIEAEVSTLLDAGSYINLIYDNLNDSLTISATGLQPAGNYSVVGHTHISSDITDFSSSVSGLLPSVSGNGYIVSSFNNNIYSISATGLQPSGNYSVSEHVHGFVTSSGQLNDGANTTATNRLAMTNATGQLVAATIANGLSVVNNLPNTISVLYGSAQNTSCQGNDARLSDAREWSASTIEQAEAEAGTATTRRAFTAQRVFQAIAAWWNASSAKTKLDGIASGATANATDAQLRDRSTHTGTQLTSTISDFNSSVSGLLPVKNISAGSGIGVSSTSGDFIVSVTGTFGLTSEEVDDRVSNLLVNGSYISLNYDDNANTLTISATGLQPSGNYSVVGHTHTSNDISDFDNSVSGLLPVKDVVGSGYISVSSSSGIYTIIATGLQPSGNYSIVGHTHTSSNITDFSSSVSGLLPSISGIDYIVSSFSNNTYNISVTGLQPSGNYSIVGHTHIISEVSGLQNALDSKQPSGVYASGIHTHLYSDITDFNSGVSGLLPSISGSGYVNSSFVNNIYTISVNGLQPSGNYSLVGHNHNASDITDFNSSVSGLLPVKDILSGIGISVSSTSGVYTINSTGSGVLADQASALVTTVFNNTGSPIPKMSAVYINGGQGDLPTVSLAIATSDMTSAGTYGLTYEAISNMQSGKVIVFGALTGLDTDQFNPTAPHGNINGTVLYLSPYVSGALTVSKPSAPNHIVAIGTVVRTHQNEGVIEVRVQNGFELEELHNVAISGVTNGQFLQYNSGSGLWVPSSSGNFTSLSVNSTGVSLNGHSHTSSNITDFNSSVSGLLPVTNIVGGANIDVVPSGSTYTISVSGSLGLTTEEVDDRVSSLLIAGTGISLNYNDNFNTLTINTSGLQPSGNYSVVGHNHNISDITDFPPLLEGYNSFETVSKNLKAYPVTFNYTSGVLTSLVYILPSGTITKTLNYTSGTLTSILLSGTVPSGIALTKNLVYTSGIITSINYS